MLTTLLEGRKNVPHPSKGLESNEMALLMIAARPDHYLGKNSQVDQFPNRSGKPTSRS